MTENTPHKYRNYIVPILITTLLVVVAAQSWFMFDMHKQLNTLGTTPQATAAKIIPDSSEMAANQASPPTAVPRHKNSPFDDNFFAQNFDMGNWNPDKQFEQMRQQMDTMMQQAFNHFGKNQGLQNFFSDNGSPDISIKDEGKQYLVLVDLPGADKNNISVTLNDNQLTVSGQQSHTENKTDRNGNTIFRSQQSGTFSRSVTLPGDVEPGSMHTEFNNDVLKITIAKAA